MPQEPTTLMIWTDFENLPLLFMFEGDLRHFDGVVINSTPISEEGCTYPVFDYQGYEANEKELTEFMYGPAGYEDPKIRHDDKLVSHDENKTVHISKIVDATYVIRCGFGL